MLENISNDIIFGLLNEMGETGICFYPGGFKPPHKGHFAAAEWLAKLPLITSVIVLIGHGVRDGINATQSQEIWDLYLKDRLPSKITTKISETPSPIKEIYRYVKAHPDQKIYLAIGEDENARRYDILIDAGFDIEVIKIPVQFNRISGTEVRQTLANGDVEKFTQAIPDFVVNKEEIFVKLTKISLNELSDKVKKDTIERLHKEKPDLNLNLINHYVTRFEQLQNSPHITQKDITKYSWKELERAIDSAPVKSTTKKDAPPTTDDADLIYNKDGLRIYKGHTKKACIKYGTGYSWCISARGEGNMYGQYRFGEGGTPYFVFDDTKSHEQNEDGTFVDPKHALVIFRFDGNGNSDGMDYPTLNWTVTDANNDGEDEFDGFSDSYSYRARILVSKYPKLKGLEDLFSEGGIDDQEEKEWRIIRKWDAELFHLNSQVQELHYIFGFSNIEDINIKLIDKILNGEIKVTKVELLNKQSPDEDFERISKTIYHHDNYELEQNVDDFIKDVTSPPSHVKPNDVEVEYKNINIKGYMINYLNDIKGIYLNYKNELNKAQINESTVLGMVLTEEDRNKAIVDDFVDFVCELIEIKKKPQVEILDEPLKNDEQPSFGAYNPNNHHIMVCFGKRHIMDSLRSLAHELYHMKQNENGELKNGDGNTGSSIENHANSAAGIIMREYGKLHPELF